MKKLLFVSCVLLVGCAETPPFTTDFNGDSVKVRQSTFFQTPDPEDPSVLAEATRICATRDMRAEYASTVPMPNAYAHDHLFLCL